MIMKRILYFVIVFFSFNIDSYTQPKIMGTTVIEHTKCGLNNGSIAMRILDMDPAKSSVELCKLYKFENSSLKFISLTKLDLNDKFIFENLEDGKYKIFGFKSFGIDSFLFFDLNMNDEIIVQKSEGVLFEFETMPQSEYCKGETIVLKLNNRMGTMYFWDTLKESNLVYVKKVNLTKSSDTIILRGKTKDCDSVLMIVYTIKPAPDMSNSISLDKLNICSGDSVIFKSMLASSNKYSVYFEGYPSYNIKERTDNYSRIIESNNDIDLKYNYFFSLNGCESDTISGVIKVNAKPKLVKINKAEVCSGSQLNVPLSINGNRQVNYTYTFQKHIDITRDSIFNNNIIKDKLFLSGNNKILSNYTVIAKYDNQCSDVTDFDVVIKPKPPVPIVEKSIYPVCFNLNTPNVITNDSMTVWALDRDFNFPKDTGKIFSRLANADKDEFIYFRSLVDGCYSSIDSCKIDVLALPIIKIKQLEEKVMLTNFDKISSCAYKYNALGTTLGQILKFDGDSNKIVKFSWSNSNNTNMSDFNSIDNKYEPNINSAAWIKLKVIDANNCVSIDSLNVSESKVCSGINFSFIKDTICQGTLILLKDFSSICVNTQDIVSKTNYEWIAENLSTLKTFKESSGDTSSFNPKFNLGDSISKYPGNYKIKFNLEIKSDKNRICNLNHEYDNVKVIDRPNFIIDDSTYCEGVINPEFKIIYNPVLLEDNKYLIEYQHINGTKRNNFISSINLKLDSLYVNDNNSKQSYNLLSVIDMFGCQSNNIDPFSLNRRSPQLPSFTSNLPICKGDSLRLNDTNLAVNQIAGWNNKQKAFRIIDIISINIGTSIDTFGCEAKGLSFYVSNKDIIQDSAIIEGPDAVCQKSQFNQYCSTKLEKDMSVQYQWIFNNVNKKTDSCYSVSLTPAEKDFFILYLVMTTIDSFGDNQCKIFASKKVIIDTTQSRASSDIQLWPGNLLVCSDSESSCYQWIRTDSTGVEENILNCNGKQACAFKELDFSKYTYSVRTSDYTDCSCAGISTYRSSVPKKDVVTEFKLYPNPTGSNSGLHLISAMEDHGLVEIYNVMGQLILQANHKIEVLKNEIQIPSEQFQSGVYFVKLKLMNQETETIFKLVKE